MKRIVSLLLLATTSSFLFAQKTPSDSVLFTLDLLNRTRTELHAAYHEPSDKERPSSLFVSQRAQVGLRVQYGRLATYLCLQDGRLWGGANGSTSLLEGWTEYQSNIGNFCLGRQTIQIADGWLFMAGRYGKTGLSHDALRYSLLRPSYDILAYAMVNALSEKNTPYKRDKAHNYKYMTLLRARFFQSFGGLAVVDVSQDLIHTLRTYPRFTLGGFVEKLPTELLSLHLEAYYQTGSTYDVANKLKRSIAAYSLHSKLLTRTKFPCGIGLDWVSGDEKDDLAQGKQHHFDRLSGSGHAFFGTMDYFSLALSEVAGHGLRDYSLWLYTPKYKGHTGECSLHTFQQDKGEASILGYELDLKYTYTLSTNFRIEAVYGLFYATSAYQQEVRPTTAHWGHFGYVSVQYAPRFSWTMK